ncbi:hypothetical protein CHLNCDRAFT_134054 [Chlorella variabilis]|uniref:FAD-binding domain-containing protein n=1 Tax=Chlorella variabilis TaxID=554065 RepID=E1ZEW3_CHLVA|nr:hypothetical protein CHLNCDRAFT_134054 [Chlorella variabilis]EFN55569.1 hypothetical protein CHLNCDRAFT_134054 [Chlorella variabilis]|eukprot:XP_005847671.1 hypothetical protein CHLNCDRAFT_134054 [Chlorella variabilis]
MAAEMVLSDSAAWGSQELTNAAAAVAKAAAVGKEGGKGPAAAPRAAQGAMVVVVGAGPAGLLAAHFLARHHGCRVEVYDRRGHPGPIPIRPGDEDDDDRAFALAMNVRGGGAVAAAGLDPAAFTSVPGTHMCEVRDTVLARGDGLPRVGGGRGSAITIAFDQPRVVGSRQAFVRALLHQVEQQQAAAAAAAGGSAKGGSVAFHWGQPFVSADLAARTATFEKGEVGATFSVEYDLLVAADGYWSRVRRAAERQAADLCVTTSPPNHQYKVVRGLRPVPHLRLGPAAGQSGYGSLFMVTEAKAGVRAAGGGPPGSFFMSQPSEEAGVTAVLSMVHARWQGLEGGTAAAYRELLRVGYPSLPDSWAEEMAAQLAVRPLYDTGMQVHASQLHAPGVVLLGDAGHAVSPATSNGMNSALEDALVLSQALEACGGDLAALPERYTAARLEDAHALQWMDRAMSALVGRGGAAAALKASLVARVILSKATGGWVRPHALVLLKDGSLPYGEAARQVRRDAAVAKLVATGLGVALVAAWLKGKAH